MGGLKLGIDERLPRSRRGAGHSSLLGPSSCPAPGGAGREGLDPGQQAARPTRQTFFPKNSLHRSLWKAIFAPWPTMLPPPPPPPPPKTPQPLKTLQHPI